MQGYVRATLRGIAPAVVAAALAGCGMLGRGGTGTETPAGGAQPTVIRGDTVPAGTNLVAQLDQQIGIDSTRPGDRFTATVAAPLVDERGQPIVPSGAKLLGRVSHVEAGGGDRPAAVGLTVDAVQVAGMDQPIQASIVGTDVEAPRRGIRPEYVLGGALGGAVLGAIIGGGKGAIIGGAIGAGAGTLVSLGTRREQARLPRGTALGVRFDAPIPVAALRAPGRWQAPADRPRF